MLDIATQLQKAFRELAKALTVLAQQQIQRKLGDSDLVDTAQMKLDGVDKLDLLMADYAVFVDKGRRPGKQPPVSVILAWLRRKRITSRKGITLNQLAYLIARSIARKGIKRRPFLNDLADDLAAYAADYAAKVAGDITDDVLAQLK